MTPHFFTVISHLLTLALVCSAGTDLGGGEGGWSS